MTEVGMEVYKFQKLDVYRLALQYVDAVYEMSRSLPQRERFNLCDQIERAATSIVLNIAEGSTGQTNPEQRRFLSYAFRSYVETVACLDLIEQHGFRSAGDLSPLREQGHQLFIKLAAFRNALR